MIGGRIWIGRPHGSPDGRPDSAVRLGGWSARWARGLNGKRPKLRRNLSDPDVRVIVVEHRDRLARLGVGQLQAALAAQGRRIVVADPGETTDDLVREVFEIGTSMCARLSGRRGARNRAMRALTAARSEPGGAP
jgi:putative resolvase